MSYFSLNSVSKAYEYISKNTKEKFWGILSIFYSINGKVQENVSYNIDTPKLSNFLEDVFRLSDKKSYDSTSAQYTVVFSKKWQDKLYDYITVTKLDIAPVIIWAYRNRRFPKELSFNELVELFVNDFHLSMDIVKELFSLTSDKWVLDYTSSKYDDSSLLKSLGGNETSPTIKMNHQFVVANAGDLSRGPYFQPLYAALQTLECLILFPFDESEYYNISEKNNDQDSGIVLREKLKDTLKQIEFDSPNKHHFLPYLTALRTKPFMLLAGISGTGKSRIVRELAKACWKEGDEEYGKNCPKNFCMVQVKPNWHDSTELFGYVSRISGKPEFVAGDFMKFVIKAWENPDVPYFLCLDEMNLAPVEQYFAEYLSVIESRKSDGETISTDAIFKKPFENKEYDDAIDYEEGMDWYQKFIVDHTSSKDLRQQFYKNGITIPSNLFVIGTVNMDETTFSFSRKVLDRAMTLEMNEVDLHGGLEENDSEIGYIGNCIIGNAAEGKDIYADNKELCDKVISYLEKVNAILDKTPFKVAYRTRNEFILYAVNRQLLDDKSQLWQTLDEMTSMKILSRIEGDSDRTQKVLEDLKQLIDTHITNAIPESEDGNSKPKSISAAKIEEMLDKLNKTSFTSYWT